MTIMQKTVLIVEDNPVQALVFRRLLRQEGLRVLRAPNGRIGVSMAQKFQPDVIVLDIEFPEINGFETCWRLRQNVRTENIPIVMLTARNDVAAVMRGIGLGAVDFIPKDAFSDTVLLETLRQLHVLESAQVVAKS